MDVSLGERGERRLAHRLPWPAKDYILWDLRERKELFFFFFFFFLRVIGENVGGIGRWEGDGVERGGERKKKRPSALAHKRVPSKRSK